MLKLKLLLFFDRTVVNKMLQHSQPIPKILLELYFHTKIQIQKKLLMVNTILLLLMTERTLATAQIRVNKFPNTCEISFIDMRAIPVNPRNEYM